MGDITDLARPQFPRGTLDGATVSYRFELTERRKVGLGLREQETDADLVVEDADGDVLGASRNAGTANEWMTITLLAGTYYVRLEAQETGVSEFVFRYGVEAAPNRAATGAPVIGGTARVGETLTADTSSIGDADGLSGVSFSYRWIRSDGNTNTDISGATAATYTLAASDEGKTIRVRVSFTDDAGHGETLTSAATAAVVARSNNPATGAPVIDGTARVGETLRADTSGIADDDGLSNAVFGYRWVANDGTTDTDISGATASTYTVAASDEGKTIRVRVSFTDDAGHDETLSSASTAAVAAEPEPEPQEPPAMPQGLTGSAVHDAVTLAWDDPGDDSITGYQILRRNRAIHAIGDFQIHVEDTSSAAASHVDRDVEPDGSYVYRIKARNGAGLSERSDYYRVDTPVASNRPATGAPVIGGTARVGETLRADISSIADEDGLENATFGYRWIADGSEILGATAATYRLVDADEGKTIEVRVSFTDDAGHEETLTSAATAEVEPEPNRSATGAPSVSGTAQVGETLRADTSGIADEDGLENAVFGYQWVADGSEISGATAATYTLVDADEGKTIRVRVRFTDDDGNAESLTSAATAAVVARSNTQESTAPSLTRAVVDGAILLLIYREDLDEEVESQEVV